MSENKTSSEGFFKAHHCKVVSSLSNDQLKEFSLLEHDDERFRFVYNLPVARGLDIQLSPCGKNAEIARKFKDEGNKAFQSGDYRCALRLYSKCILKTPWEAGSGQDLAVAVANRSAALYHLEHHLLALQDVAFAISLNYPQELRYKIFDRKARCLLARKQLKDAQGAFRETLVALDIAKLPEVKKQKWQTDVQIMLAMLGKNTNLCNAPVSGEGPAILPTLTGGHNSRYESASSAIKIQESPEMGRFAAAGRNIKAGDILVTEQAHCSVLLSEYAGTHCFHCFKRLLTPIPCPRCSAVAFCSMSCQKESMASHHKVECGILATLWASGASVTCLMALRIISQRDMQYFLKQRKLLDQIPKVYYGSDYRSVYNLVRHEAKRTADDLLHRSNMSVFLLRCLQTAGFFGVGTSSTDSELSDDENFIGGLLLRHLQLLQFNAHEVSELLLEENGSLDAASSVFLGGAVYPTLALFNHSCDPGVARYFLGTSVIVRAVKNIASGEMVAENYGPIFTQTVLSERQATLRDQYWFDCNCIPCIQNWPLFNDMDASVLRFKCSSSEKCKNVIIVPLDTMEFMIQCTECKEYINIFKGLKALQDTDAMFKAAKYMMERKDISHALPKFLEILTLLDETLAPPFRDYHLCQQAIRRCMLCLGNTSVRP
ncbi:SET and MYND domain-containing protein 4 [Anabrus simplex]|uniref:SET and MYND domain-containing protein 4 n=1 Tax=Anabrus simplex TaxID=316456 RepID=UPI0034DD2472